MNGNQKGTNGVVFETDKWNKGQLKKKSAATPMMVRWLIRYSGGLIKNEQTAALILVVVSILIFLYSVNVIVGIIPPHTESVSTPQDV